MSLSALREIHESVQRRNPSSKTLAIIQSYTNSFVSALNMTFLGISPFSLLICVGIYKENIYTYCHASVIWRLDLKAIQPATFVYHVALLLQIKSKIEEVKFFF